MKVATRDENKKYEAVFKIEYMSEDEDRTDGEGWCHLKLSWRSDELTNFFRCWTREPDKKKGAHAWTNKKNENGIVDKASTKRRPSMGIKGEEKNMYIRTSGANEASRVNRRGLRTRGGHSGTQDRCSARRTINKLLRKSCLTAFLIDT